MKDNARFYATPDKHLQQGDIFRIPIVSPIADEKERIFRSRDGRHGSVVFEEMCEARVFGLGELVSLLDDTRERTALHTEPFSPTEDGQEEMVVVFARLFRHFVIASQTCDISGLDDRRPLPWAAILPVTTLAERCRKERLPFKGETDCVTIHEYVVKHSGRADEFESLNDFDYGVALRAVVTEWIKSKPPKVVLTNAQQIRKFLLEYHKKGYLVSLPVDAELGLPESVVDFSSIFTVPTAKLEAIRNYRFARIAGRYREGFSQQFGSFFSRVALPRPMTPDDVT